MPSNYSSTMAAIRLPTNWGTPDRKNHSRRKQTIVNLLQIFLEGGDLKYFCKVGSQMPNVTWYLH